MTQAEVENTQRAYKSLGPAIDALYNALVGENRQPTQAERQEARDKLDALIEAGDEMLGS
jgi:hypothetical protein